jgi:hypothetical protein
MQQPQGSSPGGYGILCASVINSSKMRFFALWSANCAYHIIMRVDGGNGRERTFTSRVNPILHSTFNGPRDK